jgi:hypothetical protein
MVIRNHHGEFLVGECHFFTHPTDTECVELLACRRVSYLGKNLGWRQTRVPAKLGRSGQDRSLNGALVKKIKSLLRRFQHYSVGAVRRTENEEAHILAKFGCGNKPSNKWFGVICIFWRSSLY